MSFSSILAIILVGKNKIILLFLTIFLNVGTKFKTAACPVTGVLRQMEIQKGKEGMKSAQFNNTMGATAGCTVRLLLSSIPPGDQDKYGIQGDAWFGSINTANEVAF